MSVKIVKKAETEPISLPKDSWSKMMLVKDTVGAQKMSLGVSQFNPGLETALLTHEAEELAFVMKGKGKLRLADGSEVPYEAGDGIYIPAGVAHSVVVDGDEPVEMCFGFSWPAYPPTQRA